VKSTTYEARHNRIFSIQCQWVWNMWVQKFPSFNDGSPNAWGLAVIQTRQLFMAQKLPNDQVYHLVREWRPWTAEIDFFYCADLGSSTVQDSHRGFISHSSDEHLPCVTISVETEHLVKRLVTSSGPPVFNSRQTQGLPLRRHVHADCKTHTESYPIRTVDSFAGNKVTEAWCWPLTTIQRWR
jgi:hypothetical protein